MRRERTFILGSGFSANFGLPTLRGLFDQIMAQPGRTGERDIPNVHLAVRWFYPRFEELGHEPKYPPFEEFLSLVVAAQDLPSFARGYWEPVRKSALRLLTDYFKDLLPKAEEHPLLLDFAQRLGPGDVLVTFNWDNLIERALAHLRKPFNLSGEADSIAVLKLHGSFNWVRPPEGIEPSVPGSVVAIGDGVYRTADFTHYDVWDALDSPPLIVPPVASKAPLADPFLAPLWREAALAIEHAPTLSVVGYSMPDDDLQARALLCTSFHARRDDYMLVDPDPSVAAKYLRWIGPQPRYVQARFAREVLDDLFPPTHGL
jgi:hypothetical protein